MDIKRMNRASTLRDTGNFEDAYDEFVALAKDTEEAIDKAWLLLNAAATLTVWGQYGRARLWLEDIRKIASIPELSNPGGSFEPRLIELAMAVELEESSLAEAEGKKSEALEALRAILDKYGDRLQDTSVRKLYKTIRTRYAFLLAELGRYKEARPILESLSVPKTPQILFYLGYCYLDKPTYADAERLLSEALELGLPPHLDYRAHCGLGMAYYELGNYDRARVELERGAGKADAAYLKRAQIWKWLEYTCLSLGLREDAEKYAKMARPA